MQPVQTDENLTVLVVCALEKCFTCSAWHHGLSAWTGWHTVSILWVNEKPLQSATLISAWKHVNGLKHSNQSTNQPVNPGIPLSYLSCSLVDRLGTTVDLTTSFLHSSQFSAFRTSIFHSRPVHSLMLSSHRFLCLFISLLEPFPVG